MRLLHLSGKGPWPDNSVGHVFQIVSNIVETEHLQYSSHSLSHSTWPILCTSLFPLFQLPEKSISPLSEPTQVQSSIINQHPSTYPSPSSLRLSLSLRKPFSLEFLSKKGADPPDVSNLYLLNGSLEISKSHFILRKEMRETYFWNFSKKYFKWSSSA